MAVEKMKMVQIVGRLDQTDDILYEMLDSGAVQFIQVLPLINHYGFTIDTAEDNLRRTIDFNHVTNFAAGDENRDLLSRFESAMSAEELRSLEEPEGDRLAKPEVLEVVNTIDDFDKKRRFAEERLKQIAEDEEQLRLLSAHEIELKELESLNDFKYCFGRLSDIGRRTLRGNYENIPAAIIHLGSLDGEEIYLFIYPAKVEEEIQRVKDSLNWHETELMKAEGLSNEETRKKLEDEHNSLESKLAATNAERAKYIDANRSLLKDVYRTLVINGKVDEVKTFIACGNEYSYIAAWMPVQKAEALKKTLEGYDDLLFKALNPDQTSERPPTKLVNWRLFRPFEALVHMFGTPNYEEIDPTPFFAVSYMILFGAMFGDVGQGLVFAIAGLILEKMRHPNLGGVILRIGLSSTLFGFFYGSIFGNETLIPALVIKPFENVDTVLLAAIAFGVVLSTISYILGIINRLRHRDYEEGLFGKDGVTGFILYLNFLVLALRFANIKLLPPAVSAIVIFLCLAILVARQPLANMMLHKPLYQESVGSYYVESGFSLLETLISIFSNSVSFIRIGAFAINHVGLFVAFETMGKMMGPTGSVVMFIVGNLVILGLEGLIVFIQSLRLEYYEMFGKYYEGDGVPFVAHSDL